MLGTCFNDINQYALRFINNIYGLSLLVLLVAMIALDQSSSKLGFELISFCTRLPLKSEFKNISCVRLFVPKISLDISSPNR